MICLADLGSLLLRSLGYFILRLLLLTGTLSALLSLLGLLAIRPDVDGPLLDSLVDDIVLVKVEDTAERSHEGTSLSICRYLTDEALLSVGELVVGVGWRVLVLLSNLHSVVQAVDLLLLVCRLAVAGPPFHTIFHINLLYTTHLSSRGRSSGRARSRARPRPAAARESARHS